MNSVFDDIFETQKVEVFECDECKKLIDAKSNDFLTVWGNITVGLSGGLIGNNFDDEGKVSRLSIFCPICVKSYLSPYLIKAVTKITMRGEQNE